MWDREALREALQENDPVAAKETLARLPRWESPRHGRSVALVGRIRRPNRRRRARQRKRYR